jgi:hypothetical protein
MSIFITCEGGVYKHTPGNECAADNVVVIKVDNFLATVPVTGYTLELSTNHQFLHSLDEFIYVFAFGDRVGELTLSGVAFTGCVGSASGPVTNAKAESVYSHYLQNRLAAKMAPTQITLGGATSAKLLGFLTGMRLEVPNPANPIAQWVLRYQVILNSSAGNSARTPGQG